MKNLLQESIKTYGKPFSFEDMLGNIFSLDYSGHKDTWEDDYHQWLEELSGEDYIELGEQLYKLLIK